MRKYRTIQGDTWDVISYRVYHNEKFMSLLIQANLSYAEIVIFPAGVVIDVPDIDTPAFSGLPPWKD